MLLCVPNFVLLHPVTCFYLYSRRMPFLLPTPVLTQPHVETVGWAAEDLAGRRKGMLRFRGNCGLLRVVLPLRAPRCCRPKVMETCYNACGQIDLHNNHRQGQLRLGKVWKTKKWNNRLLVSMLSWEYHFPPSANAAEEPDLQSRLKEFMWRVIDEVYPTPMKAHPTPTGSCRLELIGTRITSSGKQKGMKSTIQERFTD